MLKSLFKISILKSLLKISIFLKALNFYIGNNNNKMPHLIIIKCIIFWWHESYWDEREHVFKSES